MASTYRTQTRSHTHTHTHTSDERQQNGCYKDEQKKMNVIRQLFMRLLVGRLFHFHSHIAIYIYIYLLFIIYYLFALAFTYIVNNLYFVFANAAYAQHYLLTAYKCACVCAIY